MTIARVFRMIFRPNDGSRQEVKNAVEASRVQKDKATSRFEETIRDLLRVNDEITGRKNAHHP
jgi:hypothetical protein